MSIALIPLAWGEEAVLATLGAAQSLGDAFDVVLVGSAPNTEAVALAERAGAARILLALHPQLAGREEPEVLAAAAAEALSWATGAGSARLLLVPPGAAGEALGSHLADGLAATSFGRCLALYRNGGLLCAERAAWGGRKRITLACSDGLAVASLRVGRPDLSATAAVAVTEQPLQAPLPEVLPCESRESGQRLAPLEGARLVVSGGRGVDQKGFAQLEALAGALDGSLGGSLPAVDAGMVPVMRQVGVSGKFVSPAVYLAVGISGTPQHLAGVSTDSRIVAINQDAGADIFKVASLGIVAPWQELLPELLARLEAR